jgi:hypothetical protein
MRANIQAILDRNARLSQRLHDALSAHRSDARLFPPSRRSTIVSVPVNDAEAMLTRLRAQNVVAAVRGGRCDRAMVRSLRDQIEELPIVLGQAEEDAVATVIAAIIWAVLDASVRDLAEVGDVLVA